jgi:hypothetical protein
MSVTKVSTFLPLCNRNWQLHLRANLLVLVSFLGIFFGLFSPLDLLHVVSLILRCVVGSWIHLTHSIFFIFPKFFLFLGK